MPLWWEPIVNKIPKAAQTTSSTKNRLRELKQGSSKTTSEFSSNELKLHNLGRAYLEAKLSLMPWPYKWRIKGESCKTQKKKGHSKKFQQQLNCHKFKQKSVPNFEDFVNRRGYGGISTCLTNDRGRPKQFQQFFSFLILTSKLF